MEILIIHGEPRSGKSDYAAFETKFKARTFTAHNLHKNTFRNFYKPEDSGKCDIIIDEVTHKQRDEEAVVNFVGQSRLFFQKVIILTQDKKVAKNLASIFLSLVSPEYSPNIRVIEVQRHVHDEIIVIE